MLGPDDFEFVSGLVFLAASRAYWETSGRQMGDKPEIMRPEH